MAAVAARTKTKPARIPAWMEGVHEVPPLAEALLPIDDCFMEEESVFLKDVIPKKAIYGPVDGPTPMHIQTAPMDSVCF